MTTQNDSEGLRMAARRAVPTTELVRDTLQEQ